MRLSDELAIIPLLAPGDKAAGADSDSVNMAGIDRLTIILLMGSITVADPHVKVFSGVTAGAKTTALTFRYRLGTAAAASAGADVYGAEAASADLAVSNATGDGKALVIDVSAGSLAATHGWITVELGNQATVFMASAVAIAYGRYHGATAI